MSSKDRLNGVLKDLEALKSIINRSNSTVQDLHDKNKDELNLLFPDLLENVTNAAKNLDSKGLKDQLKRIKEKRDKELEDKIKNNKNKPNK